MNGIKKEIFLFNSNKNGSVIQGFKIIPENNEVKAVLLVVHGMIEHSEKYEHFMSFLARNNIATYAHDHLGHKNSVKTKDELGFFNHKDGYVNLLEDMKSVFLLAKKENPDKKIFLMGHSMGSFFARVFAEKYQNTIDGLIISGTGESGKELIGAKFLVDTISFFKGEKNYSKTVSNLTSKKFMSGVTNPKTGAAWLTRDEEIELRISKDEYCNFKFTLSAYKDLFTIMSLSSSDKTYKNISKDIPIYIFSGENDPVGDFGKTPLVVFNKYKEAGVKDVCIKIYKDARHEMINEINKDEVYSNVLNWINNKV